MAIRAAVVQAAAITSGTTQDFTVSGFGTPKAALVLISAATANNTAVDNFCLSFGATDGTRGRCNAGFSEHNVATSDGYSNCNSTSVGIGVDTAGAVDYRVEFEQWITDGIQLDWRDLPAAAYLVSILLIGGDEFSAYVNDYVGNASANGTVDVTSVPFAPDLLVGFGVNIWDQTTRADARMSLGVADRIQSFQAATMWGSTDAQVAASDPFVWVMDSATFMVRGSSGAQGATAQISAWLSNGFTVKTLGSGGAPRNAYIAMAFGGASRTWAGVIDTPTSTGVASYSAPGWPAQALILGQTTTGGTGGADATADGGAYGIGLVAQNGSYSIAGADEDNQLVTDTQSLTDSKPANLPLGDGTAGFVATLDEFYSSGFKLNFSTTRGAANKWLGIAIEAAQHVIGNVASSGTTYGTIDLGLAHTGETSSSAEAHGITTGTASATGAVAGGSEAHGLLTGILDVAGAVASGSEAHGLATGSAAALGAISGGSVASGVASGVADATGATPSGSTSAAITTGTLDLVGYSGSGGGSSAALTGLLDVAGQCAAHSYSYLDPGLAVVNLTGYSSASGAAYGSMSGLCDMVGTSRPGSTAVGLMSGLLDLTGRSSASGLAYGFLAGPVNLEGYSFGASLAWWIEGAPPAAPLGIHERSANSLRTKLSQVVAASAYPTLVVQYDDAPASTPDPTSTAVWARAEVVWDWSRQESFAELNAYKRGGTLKVQIHHTAGRGSLGHVVACALADGLTNVNAGEVRLEVPNVETLGRVLGASTQSTIAGGSWWTTEVAVPFWVFDYSAPVELTGGLTGSDDEAHGAVRYRFNRLVEVPESLPTAYDNAPFQTPDNARHARLWVLTGETHRTELGASNAQRAIGVASVELMCPVHEGDQAILELIDKVDLAFRGCREAGVSYGTPRAGRATRRGAWWQATVRLPFQAERPS